MSQEILSVVNSLPMWIFAIILVALVAVQSFLYVKLCYKEAAYIGYPKENLKKSFRLGMVTAFGPSLTSVVAMISMMTIIGSPITWMRLSIIGAVPTEMGVASLTSQALGLTLGGPGFDLKVISLIFLMMAITGTGWLIVVIIFTPSMGKIRSAMEKRDVVWVNIFTSAATIGLFCNLGSQQVSNGFAKQQYGTLIAVVVAAIVMFITHHIIGRKNQTVRSYALTISMVVGMLVASLVFPVK